MNREKTRRLRAAKLTAVFCAALVLGWSLPGQAASPARHVDKVLVLYHEAGFAAPANRMIFTSMLKYFQEHEDRDVVLYSETLDLTLFPGKNGRRALIDFYRLKYAREHIDVVVPVQGPALDFLLENRASLFPKVPIVYLAPAEIPPQPGKDDITGVAFAIDLRGTIDIARNAQPGLKRVAVVAGAGETDLRLADLARKTLQADFKGLETIDLAGLPMDELLGRVSALPKSTAILFLPFYRDGAGRRFVPVEALKLVSSSANAPVYSTSDSHLGQGCVGGRMINYEFLGARAAWMALRIMNGEKPGDIRPEVIGNAAPLFDWRQLKRWHIPEKNLPPGSNVRYRTLTFWEKDRRYIMGMAAFSVAQLVLIAFLLLSIRTRKRVEKELRESEVRYRTVADFTYDWEYWIDPRGVFRYNSPSCERVTGYTPDDFARDPGLRRKLIIPEDQEKWERHLHEETKMLVLRSAQFRIRRKDGEVR